MANKNTVAIIQARLGSSRLPNKVLMDLGGKPILGWVVNAAQKIPGVDLVVVATTDVTADDAIANWCEDNAVSCYRGAETDVLARYLGAAKQAKADCIVRLTADCPLLDPHVCGQVVMLRAMTGADYASNISPPTWPDGLDCEVFSASALEQAAAQAKCPTEREHVTPFLRSNRQRFSHRNLTCPLPGLEKERWSIDTLDDLKFLEQIVEGLGENGTPSFMDVLGVLQNEPSIRTINQQSTRNEGLQKSLHVETVDAGRDFKQSNALLTRAEDVIPLGTQTFSKSKIQYPDEHAPLFLTHGNGGRIWDVDGNKFIDLVNGLLPVVLGYQDPDVNEAIRRQLNNGITFSLATELEIELAERLVEIIPCAEKVRIGKNGTDATSAAIRLARAFTGRDRIAVCGYHGWQDWYIGATSRHKGVPDAVRQLTHPVPYGDLDAVKTLLAGHQGEFAALIMEPMSTTLPADGYLEGVKELIHDHGGLLVFDEIITGFRYAIGGAQEYFNVTPDLAAFGKAMGNGMPISAIVGRADVMSEMEDVFYSGTFGGETLSIAAAIAVIDKMRREPVIQTLWETGQALADGVDEAVIRHGLEDVFRLCGEAPWKIIDIADHPTAHRDAIKSLLQYEMLQRGVLLLGSHNVSYAHNAADISHVLAAYDGALSCISSELATQQLEQRLPFPPIQPIFKVRS